VLLQDDQHDREEQDELVGAELLAREDDAQVGQHGPIKPQPEARDERVGRPLPDAAGGGGKVGDRLG